MEHPPHRTPERPAGVAAGDASAAASVGSRRIIDLLSDSFPVERSESEWLMTLLAADELAFIFGDDPHGQAQD